MSIEIEVRNFRGVRVGDVTANPLAIVAGLNGAGKTSICLAVSAALASQPLALSGMRKGDAGRLVADGAKAATVSVATEAGSVSVEWPGCAVTGSGKAPRASPFAAGLRSLCDLSARDMAAALADYAAANPTRDDLFRTLAEIGLSEAVAGNVWSSIEVDGWDRAWDRAKEQGAKLKGAWEQITGQRYGSDKASNWRPEAWTDDLETATAEDLAAAVEAAEAAHRDAQGSAAVSRADASKIRARAARLDEARSRLSEAERAHFEAEKRLAELRQKRAGTREPRDSLPEAACPHCGAAVCIDISGTAAPSLVDPATVPERIDREEVKAARLEIASLDGAISKLAGAMNGLLAAVVTARNAVADAEAAAEALPDLPAENEDDQKAVADALDRLRAASARADAKGTVAKAAAKHAAIVRNQALVKALAPEGLRREVMAKSLRAFNATVNKYTVAAKWEPVSIDGDFVVTMGTRPVAFLSASEKFRVVVALQLAMAEIDKSDCVVIDGADILDRRGREGLFGALKTFGRCALVGVTVMTPSGVPDLNRAKIGSSYWVSEGVVDPLADALSKQGAA